MTLDQEFNHPVIGVIGGMGPTSTLDFQMKLFKEMGKILQPQRDQDYFRVVIDNNCKIPDRTKALLENAPSPLPYIEKSIKFLEHAGASILVMPCNTSHLYFDHVQQTTKIPLINMIEETIHSILKTDKNLGKVGILATNAVIQLGLYSTPLKKQGISIVLPRDDLQNEVHQTIYAIKKIPAYINLLVNMFPGSFENQQNFNVKEVKKILRSLRNAFIYFKNSGVTHVILGCTELSMLIFNPKDSLNTILIDPSLILASRAVELAHLSNLKCQEKT